MSRVSVLDTGQGDYAQDLDLEPPLYESIDAQIVNARLDHNAIDWGRYERPLPGLGITITVLAINLVGDWLRDVLDPRAHQSLAGPMTTPPPGV